jgi:DNA-binding PucR family transcriptional regulator
VGLSDTILKGTHPETINARFEPYIDASCQVWLHLAKLFQRRRFFFSDWLLFKKIFTFETAWQNGAKLGRKHLCKILYKASSFGSIRPTNMAAKIDSFF